MPATPSSPASSGKAATATQPSATYTAAVSHLGVSGHSILRAMPRVAPLQIVIRIARARPPSRTSSANGV